MERNPQGDAVENPSSSSRKSFSVRALKVILKSRDPQSDEELLAFPDREHWQQATEEVF